MYVVALHCLRFCAAYFTLLVIATRLNVALAQNSTSQPRDALSNLQCPSGFHCFNNTVKTVTIEWGHNGHICNGQSDEECYGEKDPFGFVRGPRQEPQTVVQGDQVIFKPSEMISFKVRNVTKNDYDKCNLKIGQLVYNATSTSFEVPSKFLNPPGIKYFIDENDSLFSCNFGIKLELYVRSRQQPNCINPATPPLGVCSGVGLCVSNASKFFTRNYSCLCPNSNQGKYCEELDSCHSSRNSCVNGATCTDITAGLADIFNCTCVPGYTGNLCQHNINECASGPCKNGGFCSDGINHYTCLCVPDTEGDNCEVVIPDLCALLKPCANGGTCERSGEKRQNYTCKCPPSFTGRNCTENFASSSVHFSCIQKFKTSMLLSTTLVMNSSFARPGFSSSFGFTSVGFTSSPSASSLPQIRTSTPHWASSSLQSQRMSSVHVSLSLQQSVSPTAHAHLASTSSLAVEFVSSSPTKLNSSVQVVISSAAKLPSSLPIAESKTQVFSQNSSVSASLNRGSNMLPESTFMVSSSPATSSTAKSLPPSQATSHKLVASIHSSFLPASSAAVISSTGQTSSIQVPSRLPFPSAVISSTKISTGTSLAFLTSAADVLSKVSSSLLIAESKTQLFSQISSVSASLYRGSNMLPASTFMVSFSLVTSSTATSLPSSQATSHKLVASIHSSFLPASSAAVKTSTGQTSSIQVPSRLPFSSAVISSPKISTGTSLAFLTSSVDVLSKSTSSITTTVPLSTSLVYTSTMAVTHSRSTVLVSSSLSPTSSPTPTTVPLNNQTCTHNPCLNNGTCLNLPYSRYKFRCECPYPTVGPRCLSIKETDLHFPGFRNGSFLEHKSISFNNELNKIDVTFQTNATEGLILFAADHKERGDFIQLRLVGGKLEFRFNPGDSLVIITSNHNVNTGETISATATYVTTADPPFGTLQVGKGVQLKGTVKGKLKGIQLYGSWYVGGVPHGLSMPNKTKDNAAPAPSFLGAIRDVQVNGEPINLADATNWFNIDEGDMPPCERMPCQNNGKCIPHEDNVHDYSCNCTTGYSGKNCKIHTACKSESCNGGECVSKDSSPTEFICLCPYGRVGVQCETIISITVPLFTIVQSFPSFLEYPVPKDAVRSFHVTFLFKVDNSSSSWNDSLLVYSAQNKFEGSGDDFFAIGLKNNTVLLQYNLGSGIARIFSEPLDTSKDWHLVVAGRDDRDGYLYVDNQQRKAGRSGVPLIGLNLFEPLYIGGVPDIRQLPSVLDFKSGGFHGAIYDIAIKFSLKKPFIQLSSSNASGDGASAWAVVRGRNVGNESYNECTSPSTPCTNGGNCTREGATFLCSCPQNWAGLYCQTKSVPCYSYNPCVFGTCRPDGSSIMCDCPLGKTGQHCDQDITIQTPLFQNFSYMMFTKTNVRSTTQITITFKPAVLSGILFYVARDEQSTTGDFLSIYLHNGFVKLRYDLGKGFGEAKSNSTVSLDTWYTVRVSRTAKNASLSVNGNTPIHIVSPGTAVALDVKSNFFLGGVRKLSTVNPNAVDNDSASVQDFSGCINQLQVNGILYFQSNTKALEGRNIGNCPPV